MRSLITNVSLLCWGMVFFVKLLIAATSAHDLSSAELAQTAKFPSQIQQRFSLSSDDAGGDRFASRRIRSQSALRQPKIYGGTKATGYTKNSPGLPLLSSSASSASSSFLSSFTSSLSSSFASAGLSPTSLSSSLAAAAAASSLSSSSSSSSASSSLFSSSSKSILFGRPGDNADSVTTALEYMEGTLTASQMAKCENLPLLGQFKGELDRQSFNTFISEGSGPVWLANILSRLNLVSGPSSTSSAGDSSDRKSFHSVLLRSLLSQSRTLAGAAIVVSEGDPVTPNNTQHLYVYPEDDHYVTLDTVSEQRRKVYAEMLQQYLNSNNQSARSNRGPDEAYKKMSDTLPPRRDRIKFKAVNFKAGSWSNIYFDCNLSKSWLLSYAAPYLDSRGAYR